MAFYDNRNLIPSALSSLNRAVALGLTGFPFASAAALQAAIVAQFNSTTLAAVFKPTPRRIAVDVDNELRKYISAGIITSAVFGAANAAAARAALAAQFIANGAGVNGTISVNQCSSHLGD